jgi:predicted ATPase/class 3 adenylate cyclase
MDEACNKCLLRPDQIKTQNEIPFMAQYVPFRIARLIGERPCCFFERPYELLRGVVVYFDIVGFTKIVASHINSGKDIAVLSDVFRVYYSLIIDTIKVMGGSVYQFAGDSLLICFEQLDGEDESSNWIRAISAMTQALVRSNAYNRANGGINGFTLEPKIGIGYGNFFQILLGTRDRFITPVLSGQAVNEAITSEHFCRAREIVIGANAWSCACIAGQQDFFTERQSLYVLSCFPENLSLSPVRPVFPGLDELMKNPRYYNRLNAFINPMIQQQIKKRFQGFIGEYREITAVMIRFAGNLVPDANDTISPRKFDNLNAIYELIQEKTSRYNGFCTSPDFSDKGLVFLLLFGAPSALEHKEQNAIHLVEDMLHEGALLPPVDSITIGVTTGDVYCGELGGLTRKDYGAVGSIINFAARLMMTNEGNCAFMDEATRKKTGTLCDVEPSRSISLKGFAGEQAVFKYAGLKNEHGINLRKIGMVGRDREMNRLMDGFRKSLSGAVQCLPIIGDAGIGKTYLVENFALAALQVASRTRVFAGWCYQYEETTLFFPWRSILRELTGLREGMTHEAVFETTSSLFLKYFPREDSVWVSFYLDMLGYSYGEHDALREIDVAIKQERFFGIVRRIIGERAMVDPLIIVLEDIHWADSMSLRMLEGLMGMTEASRLFIIPVSRDTDHILKFFRRLQVDMLCMDQLDQASAETITRTMLALENPDEALVARIVSISDCNPFFIENIVQNMLESGVLVDESDGSRYLSKDPKRIKIPSSMQNIILSRLNTLLFEEQIIFKTASVIGRTFMTDILRAMIPAGISEYVFYTALENFEAHNLVVHADEQRSTYYFTHGTIRDVVYNTILESTRKELNRVLFSYLENRYSGNIASVVERLEYHATEAGDWNNVYRYALLSAAKSMKRDSSLDAITHYNNAFNALKKMNVEGKDEKFDELNLALATAYRKIGNYDMAFELYNFILITEKKALHRAAVLQGIGQCYQEQGKFDEAVTALEDALDILGQRAPKNAFGIGLSICRECLYQLGAFVFTRNEPEQLEGEKREYAKTRSDILVILNKLYYFDQINKVAWGTVSNFTNTLKIQSETDRWCVTVSNYALTLVSSGFLSVGLHYFNVAGSAVSQSKSRIANGVYKARYAYYFLFYSQPQKSIDLLEDATNIFRSTGEAWELMTAVGALAQNYFLIAELDRAEKSYLEAESIARRLNSPMHIGWAYNKIPFIRFLRGTADATEAIAMLNEGIAMSERVHDHMTLCIHYGHLAYIAEMERDVDAAIKYASEIVRENRVYSVNIPHVKISWVNAAESLCFALESGRTDIDRSRLIHLAKYAVREAELLGHHFSLIDGPSKRAAARLALNLGKPAIARELCLKSIAMLRATRYEWEYANALLLAARCIPEDAKSWRDKAEAVFLKIGVCRF